MKKVIVVVDVQNDFVDGPLGNEDTRAVAPKIADYIRAHADSDTILLFTKDTHESNYLSTQEGKNLPIVHCIKDSWGWELAPVINEALYETRDKYDSFDSYFPYVADHIICKPSFGSMDLMNLLFVINDEYDEIGEITFVGIDTAICVISNVMLAKATLPNVPIRVIADCCASMSAKTQKTALDAMRLCQVDIVEETV